MRSSDLITIISDHQHFEQPHSTFELPHIILSDLIIFLSDIIILFLSGLITFLSDLITNFCTGVPILALHICTHTYRGSVYLFLHFWAHTNIGRCCRYKCSPYYPIILCSLTKECPCCCFALCVVWLASTTVHTSCGLLLKKDARIYTWSTVASLFSTS